MFGYFGADGVEIEKMEEKNGNETLCGIFFFSLFWGLKKFFFIVVKYTLQKIYHLNHF